MTTQLLYQQDELSFAPPNVSSDYAKTTFERMEERVDGGSAPPCPPPPPTSLPGSRTIPLLQPGSRPTADPRSGILHLEAPEDTGVSRSGVDSEYIQRTADGRICQTSHYTKIQYELGDHGGIRQPNLAGVGSGGPGSSKYAGMEFYPSRREVPTTTSDTELALSLVNETRPTFEMRTSSSNPLSEEHLMSLVNNSSTPVYKPASSPQSYTTSYTSRNETYTTTPAPMKGGMLQAAYDHKKDQLLNRSYPVKSVPSPPIRDSSSYNYNTRTLSSSPKPQIGGMLGAAYDHKKDQMIRQGYPVGARLSSPLNIDTTRHTLTYGSSSPRITPTSPRYGAEPVGNVSSRAPDFDVELFVKELDMEKYSPSTGIPSSPIPNVDADYSEFKRTHTSSMTRSPPINLDWGTPRTPVEGSVHSLTNRMLSNMHTGDGAAGDHNCTKCNEAITGKRSGCTALNATYHLDCFVCVTCGKRLAGGSFYSVNGKAYCENDYYRSKWAYCGKCNKLLRSNSVVHHILEDKPYCMKCYRETLEKCGSCGKSIMEKILRAGGKAYHPGCFVCIVCNKCLDGVPFTVDSHNANHCVSCFHDKYAPRCAVCSKPIVPESGQEESVRVVAMDKSFHVKCYKCEDCGLQLSSKKEGHGCYPLDEHLYCHKCSTNRIKSMG